MDLKRMPKGLQIISIATMQELDLSRRGGLSKASRNVAEAILEEARVYMGR